MTNIAVVEDNETVRQTLRKWVDSFPGCRCVGAFANTREALAELPALKPHVVLMDIHLPDESGIICTAKLKERLPGLQVIILTVYKDHDKIFQALRAGACGYLLKRCQREEILQAIQEVRAGGAPMTGEIARRVVEAFQRPPAASTEASELSPREKEVLDLLSKGMANKQIAGQLGISYETACVHLRHIYEKLHVRSRTEAVLKYLGSRGEGALPEGMAAPKN